MYTIITGEQNLWTVKILTLYLLSMFVHSFNRVS